MTELSLSMASSLDAYRDSTPDTEYQGFVPDEWERFADVDSDGYSDLAVGGFYGAAYRNPTTGEIVIAFRGMDGLLDVNEVDAAYSGFFNEQIALAQQFFDRIRADNPTSQISLTGHSQHATRRQLAKAAVDWL